MDMTYRSSSLKFTSTELCCYTKTSSSSSASDLLLFTDLKALGDLAVLHRDSGWAKWAKKKDYIHSILQFFNQISPYCFQSALLFLPVISQ